MSLPRVLVLYNEPTLPTSHPDAEAEHEILDTTDWVIKSLAAAGLPVCRFGASDNPQALIEGLEREKPDVVFNLYEGTAQWGLAEAYVSGILELLRLPYTGSPTQPLVLARSKPLSKKLFVGAGLSTAAHTTVESLPVPACTLGWPVIVKPANEDASVGIEQASVVTNQDQLDDRVRYLLDRFGPPVLIEDFIRGREFHVTVWDRDGTPQTLPFCEILFVDDGGAEPIWPIISFDAKWNPQSRDYKATPVKNPAEVTPELEAVVSRLAIQAFHLVGCRDYARVDIRIDDDNRPYLLEVNPNPCLNPLAGVNATLASAKISYDEFVVSLVRAALRRGPRPEFADAIGAGSPYTIPKSQPSITSSSNLRIAQSGDVSELVGLSQVCDALTPNERIDLGHRLPAYMQTQGQDVSNVLVLTVGERVVGFTVTIPSNISQGVFSLETIVVASTYRRSGLGRQLLTAAEQAVVTAGGRLLIITLSSSPQAAATRLFLTQCGYRSAGEIADYYKDGTALMQYAKLLSLPVIGATT